MVMGVYCLRNKVDGRVYVGQSIKIEKRISDHVRALTKPVLTKNVNPFLFDSVKQHGIENFEFLILEPVDDRSLLLKREYHWIKHFNSDDLEFGYNLRVDGPEGAVFSRHVRHMYDSKFGDKNPNWNKKWSDEMKERASAIAKERHEAGCFYDDEWRKKISEKSKEAWASKSDEWRKEFSERICKMKTKYSFLQFSREGELIKVWDSMLEIKSVHPEHAPITIYSVCNGYKKTYKGYVWKKILRYDPDQDESLG